MDLEEKLERNYAIIWTWYHTAIVIGQLIVIAELAIIIGLLL